MDTRLPLRAGNAGGDDTGRRNATLLLAEIEQGEIELRRHYHGAMEANPGRRNPQGTSPRLFRLWGGTGGDAGRRGRPLSEGRK